MFHSIRWRLVASYVFLTLLTVGLMALMGLSLIRSQTTQREVDHLSANAAAVAQQAVPLMQSPFRDQSLQELAQTAAFLSNARVRIVDADGELLADSGPGSQVDELVWIAPPAGMSLSLGPDGQVGGPVILALPGRGGMMGSQATVEGFILLEELPPGMEYTVVQRLVDTWGSRLAFESGHMSGSRFMEQLRKPGQADGGSSAAAAAVAVGEEPFSPTVSLPVGDADRPMAYVQLRSNLDAGAGALRTTRQAFLLAGLGAAVLALLMGLAVSQGLAAPLGRLTAAASRMSGGDLSVRATVQGKDEIGQLAHQFNLMAQRLEASFAELAAERDALRRFIADASHELRTPITALKSFNELLRGPAADDADAQAEFLAESQVQIERLEWITHNLLNLSRLEAGLVELELANHSAGDLVEAAAAPLSPLAAERGIDLQLVLPDRDLSVCCDRHRVELALSNLLDNALKFTPAGGKVDIGARKSDGGVLFSVEDSGTGIASQDLPHIFERFYRGDHGRVEGTGLGLAIVQGVVNAHGGTIAVSSEVGAGTRVAVELPDC